MEDIFEWLIPVLFFSVPLVAVLGCIASVIGNFLNKDGCINNKLETIGRFSVKLLIGWFRVFAVLIILVMILSILMAIGGGIGQK
ncbi:MAG: hypothetical protein IJZ65_03265 [Ruminiclostridium sp.]|nr:hypothetical protein [Ruminiclostridium sp.]